MFNRRLLHHKLDSTRAGSIIPHQQHVFSPIILQPRHVGPRPAKNQTDVVQVPQTAPHPSAHSDLPPRVKQLLESPILEQSGTASPIQLIKVTEAFWAVSNNRRHSLSLSLPPTYLLFITVTHCVFINLQSMKKQKGDPGPPVIKTMPNGSTLPTTTTTTTCDYDIAICGGTLGIFAALALQQQGNKVAVIEKRILQGRNQEWNITREELHVLVTSGLLTHEELQQCIATEWQNDRVAVKGGKEVWVTGVLDVGVSPKVLLELLKNKFIALGGALIEHTAFKTADVYSDGVLVHLAPSTSSSSNSNGNGSGNGNGSRTDEVEVADIGDVNRPLAVDNTANTHNTSSASDSSNGYNNNNNNNATNGASNLKHQLTCRLLIDCMGHYSPIVKQIRNGQTPDGMVIVCGGAIEGIPAAKNTTADLIYTFTDASNDMQMFWEAFPTDGGKLRTAYMFTYSDIDTARPTFTELLDTYCKQLPEYQGVPFEQLKFHRLLFGGFPCYMKGSPLKPAFDRVLQIGDASAVQSPLSFGGFASMVKHLPRLQSGIHEALEVDKLDKNSLAWLTPYQPCLSLAWLFQRSMSLKVGQLRTTQQVATEDSDDDYLNSTTPTKKTTTVRDRPRGWLPPDHINRLMRCNFAVMSILGKTALHSFLTDAMKLLPLAATMLGMMLKDPVVVTKVLFQVGPMMIVGWFGHFLSLAVYTVLYNLLKPVKSFVPKKSFRMRRLIDALQWGSSSV